MLFVLIISGFQECICLREEVLFIQIQSLFDAFHSFCLIGEGQAAEVVDFVLFLHVGFGTSEHLVEILVKLGGLLLNSIGGVAKFAPFFLDDSLNDVFIAFSDIRAHYYHHINYLKMVLLYRKARFVLYTQEKGVKDVDKVVQLGEPVVFVDCSR